MKTHNILSIDEFKTNIRTNSRLLGIDPGEKNVGIAICDENHAVATPLKTIKKNIFANLVKEINDIISENEIKGVVIGNPINMDGTKGKSSQRALDFSTNLSKNITVPIAMWDERLSSRGAFNLSNDLNVNTSKKISKLDENSAAFILQGALDFLKREIT